MKITSIKQQVKRSNRYSVFVDEQYSFSLSESALLESGLASGRELTFAEVDDYKRLSADDKVYNLALRYVAMRPRSAWELSTYLQRKDAPESLTESIIQKLTDLDLLNDGKFAASFVHNRQLLRPTSRRKLILELKQKRIAEEHIQSALEQNELSEADSLEQVIIKKRRQSKYQDDNKLMQYLARQGFGYGDIKSALAKNEDD
ncbi:MAG: regulatory protein RecX [Candidatus Saccharibacteria bacterium]|nr:regulatory protein RecX [Candidatus Saccharibacteria bacterium]